jgi:protein TonB
LSDLDAGEPSLQIPPVYPPRAKRMGIEGEVTVEFTITADGSVEDAKIVEADPSRVFDRAVLRAIRRWKFAPRIVNGRAIERRARKQIVFKLERR